MTKQEIRQQIRERKRQHTAAQLITLSQPITQRIVQRISRAEEVCAGGCGATTATPPSTILLYHSLPDEVHTHTLIETLLGMGKTVILPAVRENDLVLRRLTDPDRLTSGAFGIAEPDDTAAVNPASIDLAIIPGVAFTPAGHRLGRGRGFYDRLLPRLTCPLIGLAFPFQIVGHIPCEPHDIMMDEVIWK